MLMRSLPGGVVLVLMVVTSGLTQQLPVLPPPVPFSGSRLNREHMEASSRYSLMRLSNIQNELQLDDLQRQTLREISSEIFEYSREHPITLPNIADRDTEVRRQFEEARKAKEEFESERYKRAFGLLHDAQLQRLAQLELQRRGLQQLISRPDLADRLRLTNSQMETVRDLYRESIRNSVERMRERQANAAANPQGLPNIIEMQREEFDADVLANVFTEEQRAAWAEMLGPKFEFRVTPPNVPAVPPPPAKPEGP